MSAFQVSLSPTKIKEMSPEQIEEQLIAAAAEQIEKKDCSQIYEFLKEDFPLRTIAEWARAKFDIKLDAGQLKALNFSQIKQLLNEQTGVKYREREIEYPVEFAMNMVYGPQGPNVYAFESLANWANRKYKANLSIEQVQEANPRKLQSQLLELSQSFYDGKLERGNRQQPRETEYR